jgi:HPt (histidine-containing phosphotransfer) domain-containing protein
MDDYLTKPIRPAELAEALERAARPPATVLEPGVLDRLLETTGGDPAFVGVLLETFAEDAPGLIAQLGDALSADDARTALRAAHTLKSNAATFGASALSALCADLEARARTGDLRDGARLFERIEESYAVAGAELAQLHGRLAGS